MSPLEAAPQAAAPAARPAGTLVAAMLRRLLLVAGGASLLFGLLFFGLYRQQLIEERTQAAEQVSRLLRGALENAMLKRDVEGLRDIVNHLGAQPGIAGVMILTPAGEVRFASRPGDLGRHLPELTAGLVAERLQAEFLERDGEELLRSFNPVPNQPACVACHGDLQAHPVNGVLVVDLAAGAIREASLRSAGLFAGAGIAVLGLTLALLWWLLRRRVIDPLAALAATADALASGDLGQRAGAGRNDETGRLAASFNRMADRLAGQLQQAAEQRRYLQELLDGLPDGVRVIRQADYQVLAVNAAFARQLGISAPAALGQPCYRLSHGRSVPCPQTLLVCPLVELRSPAQSLVCRHRHKAADGREVPVEVHASLLEHDAGALIVESIVDLSHAVRHSQEQRLSELGLLAAGIAHEIHNPLGSMRLAVDGLLRALRQGQAEPQRLSGYLEMMSAEIDRCTGVTQRLLLLSRLPQQQAQRVALHPAVADTVTLLEFDARSHRIEQQLQLAGEALAVLADDSDLRMLVLNLVQNAHHAMPDGGCLQVSTAAAGKQALIEVRDSGCGIPADVLARIFDPFYSRRADGEGGTGLGLTICKSIVERYGGRIEVASVVGEGTVFRVYLPRAEE